jgi:signal recognition particle receptor subunit beta
MASLNPLTRELLFKIVFYGPGLGGKTTTLQYIHGATKPENRGKLVSLATPTDRTLYFDFLPIRLQRIRNMGVRLQLFTVPGQVYYSATRKLVLTGADGVVFVADSQTARVEANQESLEDLNTNLADHGRALSQLPHMFHWNKRDLADIASEGELDRRFNLFSAPSVATKATTGEGIFEGLEQITRLVLEAYRAELPKGDSEPMVLEPDDAGIAEAIRSLAERTDAARSKHVAVASELVAPVGTNGAAKSVVVGAEPTSTAEDAAAKPADAPVAGESPAGTSADAPSGKENEEVRRETSRPPAPANPRPRTQPSPEAYGLDMASFSRKAAPVLTVAAGAVASLVPTVSPPDAAAPTFSLAPLFAEGEREAARNAEHLLSVGEIPNAVLACDRLLTRILASAAGLAGSMDAPRDPGLVCLLLGLDGRRYLHFRAIVRAARGEETLAPSDALEAYAFAVEARLARDSIVR